MRRPAYRGPILDLHAHLSLRPDMQIGEEFHGLIEYHESVGKYNVHAYGALAMAPRDDAPTMRKRNDAVLELHDTISTVLPLCSVHPADGQPALEELERVSAAGAVGVKLHPNTQGFDVADPGVLEVVRRAGQLQLPVLFDAYAPADPAQPGKFLELAIQAPEAQVIMAHALGPRFQELAFLPILERYPFWKRNLWMDLSAAAVMWADSPYREHFLWVCRQFGTDRLLFGSDFPFFDVPESVEAVSDIGFTPDELAGIYYGNASELLNTLR